MTRPIVWLATVTLWLATPLLVAGGSPLTAQVGGDELGAGCTRVKFDEPPLWVIGGAWDESAQEDAGEEKSPQLLLADLIRNNVSAYSLAGRRGPSNLATASRDFADFNPVSLMRSDTGWLVRLKQGRIADLGTGHIRELDGILVRPARPEEGRALGSVGRVHLVTTAGPDIVFFADVRFPGPTSDREDDVWRCGFLRVPIRKPPTEGGPETVDFLGGLSWDYQSRVRRMNRLAQPYIAALGATAYILVMDEEPKIFRSSPSADGPSWEELELSSEQTGLTTPPDLAFGDQLYETLSMVMRRVETSTMAAGLYGWQGHLYLLSREPRGGRTAWWLRRIDPTKSQVWGPVAVDTAAPHLVVVPGEKQWALVEKGPYVSYLDQHIPSVLYVDSGLIRKLANGSLCKDDSLVSNRLASTW